MIISERRSVVPEVLLVLQHNAAEYGAICLAMVLGFHGAHAPLDELRIEGPLLYRGIRQEQSYFNSLFLPRLERRWQMTSQGLVLLFEVGTWPPHDGFRRMGRFNLCSVLADDGRQGLRTLRTHLTHRPREDTFLPEQKLAEPLISAADRSCGLRYDRGHTVAPAELGAVNPHAV